MTPPNRWKRWLWPLKSRKVQVAVATVVAAYAAQLGADVREETVRRDCADSRNRT